MEKEILEKLQVQEEKINQILSSVEKTRKYFLWTLIITGATIILPLIGLIMIIPFFLKSITPNFAL